jgi:transcriptional regulator
LRAAREQRAAGPNPYDTVTYRPPYFRVDDRATLLGVVARYPLATLITWNPPEPALTHLPMLATADDGELLLQGHIARANGQWRGGDGSGIAVFRAADHYISPGWYAAKRVDGRAMPTFNYVAVEARGPVRFVHERDWLLPFLHRLTDAQEAQVGGDWSAGDAPADYLDRQLGAIVGVEMRVQTLIGTFKLSQNHPQENIEGILAGFAKLGTPESKRLASFMRAPDVS